MMDNLSAFIADIPLPDRAAMAQAQQHLDGLLKPPGSLGRLEALAVQLAGMPGLQGQLQLAEKAIVVMCADHGVWHEGVAISPQAVTAIQAINMTRKIPASACWRPRRARRCMWSMPVSTRIRSLVWWI
jgi:nicotinate-nucleotide--dimethylbenzimidazole phosphoribosyltransferase